MNADLYTPRPVSLPRSCRHGYQQYKRIPTPQPSSLSLSPPPLYYARCTSRRFVARSGVTRLKRYQIDRIFHTGTQRSPKEAMEADFDIVFSSFPPPSTSSVRSTTTVRGSSSTKTEFQRGLDDGRGGSMGGGGGGGSGAFEMAEAEAVLVISQVR